MPENWGPYFIVASILRKSESRSTVLRESFDYEVLRQELITNGLSPDVVKVINPWFYRKQNSNTWLMIGESDNIEENFPVEWDISRLQNGSYEIMVLMQVFVAESVTEETIIARQNIAEVTIQN
jgi:hypothetical protein